jgi:hypothetical protein
MRVLRVDKLRYRIEPGSGADYEGAKPITLDLPECNITLDRDVAIITMTAGFDSFDLAKDAVEPYLRSWEVHAGLKQGSPVLTFKYDGGEGTDTTGKKVYNVVSYADTLRILMPTRREYPHPPRSFAATEEVQQMWNRYCGWLHGREPLDSMAYFCLTVVEKRFGGRSEAARKLNMSKKVVERIGCLTSRLGDRKATTLRPHTTAEQAWLVEAVRVLILRLGEYETGRSPRTKITMSGLRALT